MFILIRLAFSTKVHFNTVF